MSINDTALTILHIEDDPALVKLVQLAFAEFGFRGTMISAGCVAEAHDLLDKRARNGEPVNLILVDMQLPDGLGLDVIREVKADPAWQMTPVIVLSGEMEAGMINGAYALGANCYLPKIPRLNNSFYSLQTFYKYWLEAAILPEHPRRDPIQDALARAIRLRARTSDYYLRLAHAFAGEPEEMGFWFDCSLNEGNLSNLLAFFRNVLSQSDVSAETIERLADMQIRVRKALKLAEDRLHRKPAPRCEEVCRWVMDMTGVLDEELVAEVLGCLFPKGPAATAALKARAASQLQNLANHILATTKEAGLCQRARTLLAWGERLAAELAAGQACAAGPAGAARQENLS